MPSRGELISAGFAGLAGILDTSSDEEDDVSDRIPADIPPKRLQDVTATGAADSSSGNEDQGAGPPF